MGSFRPALNQHGVKPFQTAMLPMLVGEMLQMFLPWKAASEVADGLLKAKITTTTIGR